MSVLESEEDMTKGAAHDLTRVTVAEAMHPGVISCPHGAPLRAVARMMAAYKVHCVCSLRRDR
jgi:hypothetical protein